MGHTPVTRATDMAKRRQSRDAWFSANGSCRQCGSSDNLELDHVEPGTKVSHNVWSWTPARRDAELKKCQALCRTCHRRKTSLEIKPGRVCPATRKITDRQVLKAVLLREIGWTTRKIGKKFGISHATVTRLTNAAMDGKDFRHRGELLET